MSCSRCSFDVQVMVRSAPDSAVDATYELHMSIRHEGE